MPSKRMFVAFVAVAQLGACTPWITYRICMRNEGTSGDSMMAAGISAITIHGLIVGIASLLAAITGFQVFRGLSIGYRVMVPLLSLIAGPGLLALVVMALGW